MSLTDMKPLVASIEAHEKKRRDRVIAETLRICDLIVVHSAGQFTVSPLSASYTLIYNIAEERIEMQDKIEKLTKRIEALESKSL